HFLRETVVPDLLEHGEGVAAGGAGFLDGVTIAGLAVGQERAAAQQIGAGESGGAVDLAAVVHAARLGPAVFRQRHPSPFVLDDAPAMIFAARLVAVDVRAEMGLHAPHGRFAEEPAGVLDGMAAHVEQDAATRALDIPEPRLMRSEMLLALLDQKDV